MSNNFNIFNLFLFVFFSTYDVFAVENNLESELSELVLLDSIAVLRVGSSGLAATYYSDAWFLTPFGTVKNLEEVIIQNIWIAYGNEHGIKMTSDGSANEYSEQYFDMLQEQKNVSRRQIEEMAGEFGYSLDDVKKELNNKYLMEQTVETFFAASGKLNISNDDIVDFYNNYPRYEEASFMIESGTLIIDDSARFDINDTKIMQKIVWSNEPYFVLKKDLNKNFSSIEDCLEGDVVYYEYLPAKKYFLCYRLREKKESRRLSFNELYEEITRQIQAIKYNDGYKIITEDFLLSSNVVYQDIKLQKQCIDYLKK